jgi:shikimate dehydrogenase
MEKVYGLIGATLSHSFSKTYFDEKFFREGLRDHRYELFPIAHIEEIESILKDTKGLSGLNVTIPYKEQVMAYVNDLDPVAKNIGAVNVLRIRGGKLEGFNTDAAAFHETISKWLPEDRRFEALILGTGGSSKAVKEALTKAGIAFQTVSRTAGKGEFVYDDLAKDKGIISGHQLIINTTPVGMMPNTNAMPPIPYEQIGAEHYVYDLIYNPARTIFLQKAEMKGANIKNGLEMLQIQAEKSWDIWNAGQ